MSLRKKRKRASSSAYLVRALNEHSLRRMRSGCGRSKRWRKRDDQRRLVEFLTALIGLRRSVYERAIKAIRRYVTATHRIADETSLAYGLFVMSLEAFAQTADAPTARWTDYEEVKRKRIDNALNEAPDKLKERVRSAVLDQRTCRRRPQISRLYDPTPLSCVFPCRGS